ncbi:zinc ribbon domain-containing protein [Kocuria atrinae]|uniref:zinc ribbon domain-containing protein n=1 Tax=Kocuria atrinae TaxID=592377 RepID=UPI0021D41FA8|nr:zinc ribbon domain-containing protein [Kocuria atrinae]
MSTTPKNQLCPVCGGDARKLFSAANLSTLNSSRARAIDRTARTAETPDVVNAP